MFIFHVLHLMCRVFIQNNIKPTINYKKKLFFFMLK